MPNFILVDFFNEGSPINAVDALNNVTSPVNRIEPPLTPSETPNSEYANSGGKSGGELVLDDLLLKMDKGKNPTWGDWIISGGDWGFKYSISL